MDAYHRCTNLEKNLAYIIAIYGRGREIFRPPTYIVIVIIIIKLRSDGPFPPQ
jgi:hypothetical protein